MTGRAGGPFATVLVLGAAGQVGSEMTRAEPPARGRAGGPALRVVGRSRADVDVTRPETIRRAVDREAPAVVVNLAAWTDVDGAETRPEAAFRVNRDGAAHVARICADAGVALLHVSTDYVFSGDATAPYRETDPPGPVNVYGASKLAGEREVLAAQPAALVLRTSAVYGARGSGFVRSILSAAGRREELRVVDDQRTCPTAAPDLAATLLSLAGVLSSGGDGGTRRPAGLLHWAGGGEATWLELARAAVEDARDRLPLAVRRIVPISTEEYGARADRPRYTVLDCSRAEGLGCDRPPWRESVRRVVAEIAAGAGRPA